jgi:hypothetical protein
MSDNNINESSVGIQVELIADYAVVCETLERIGVVNRKEKKIFPSCYCHKVEEDGETYYFICHFKELFALQGKPSTFNKLDKLRTQTITYFLQKWNLIKVINSDDIDKILSDKIDVVKHSEKKEYQVVHKFRYEKNFNIKD